MVLDEGLGLLPLLPCEVMALQTHRDGKLATDLEQPLNAFDRSTSLRLGSPPQG